eukprot:Clim_evm4s4 gene=Clim_evmTU4s4
MFEYPSAIIQAVNVSSNGTSPDCDFASGSVVVDDANGGKLNVKATMRNGGLSPNGGKPVVEITDMYLTPFGTGTNQWRDNDVVTVYYNAYDSNYMTTCDWDYWLLNRGCPGVSMDNMQGGVNIPVTGQITFLGFGEVNAKFTTISDDQRPLVWERSLDFTQPYGGTNLSQDIIATKEMCNVKSAVYEVYVTPLDNHLVFDLDYSWGALGCEVHVTAGTEYGEVVKDDMVVVWTAPARSEYRYDDWPVTRIAACTIAEFNSQTGCGSVAPSEVIGGLNIPKNDIPYTGQLQFFNAVLTFGHTHSSSNALDLVYPPSVTFPGSKAFSENTQGVIASRQQCQVSKTTYTIAFYNPEATDPGSLILDIDYVWLNGGCTVQITGISQSAGAIDDDGIVVYTAPKTKKDDAVPETILEVCTTVYWSSHDGCPHVTAADVLGGINVPSP